ncbi:MAG: hypothetical protein KDD70_08025, partial [Bdellovibrionales bacterium]|nr:hypothetical protein [Bdellovibrionales bacterium]
VSVGDKVSSRDLVAEAELSGDLYILRLPERMGLEVSEVLEGLQVKEGDSVSAGDVLCSQSGLFGLLTTQSNAPEAGTIEFIAKKTGHVGLRLPPNRISIDAYIPGEVVHVVDRKSVTIASELCFIQGIFGVGGERQGTLKQLDIDPAAKIVGGEFASEHRGAICVGGSSPSYEALLQATDSGIAGLVCGSIDDEVLAKFLGYELGIALTGDEDIPFTIVVTEGFGELPLSERVVRALAGLDGRLCSMNGKTQVRAGAVRPELIVDTHGADAPQQVVTEELSLTLGSRVRLLRVPYFGQFAEVTELPVHEELIPTGAKTRVLRAKLPNGETVTVPRANVELI